MEPSGDKLLLATVIAIVAVALPASAAAEPVVPPENSAATQYTEAIPTGGGQKDAGKSGNSGKRSPSSVLGSKKAKKLNAHGPQGQAAAQVAAETAPPSAARARTEVTPEPAPAPHREASHSENESRGGTTNRGGPSDDRAGGPAQVAPPPRLDASAGASGLGEVLGQATGASSGGELGPLLPLLVLATLIWALLYAMRRKRPVT